MNRQLPTTWLPDEIRKLEEQYGFSTEEMRRRFRAGLLEDTADIARWFVLAKARGDW